MTSISACFISNEYYAKADIYCVFTDMDENEAIESVDMLHKKVYFFGNYNENLEKYFLNDIECRAGRYYQISIQDIKELCTPSEDRIKLLNTKLEDITKKYQKLKEKYINIKLVNSTLQCSIDKIIDEKVSDKDQDITEIDRILGVSLRENEKLLIKISNLCKNNAYSTDQNQILCKENEDLANDNNKIEDARKILYDTTIKLANEKLTLIDKNNELSNVIKNHVCKC